MEERISTSKEEKIDMNLILEELKKFSEVILSLNNPVVEIDIVKFEQKYKLLLPLDYKEIIREHNGFSLLGNEVYGIFEDANFSSIEGAYNYEHTHSLYPMPQYLIPFSPDGAGNHYCFDGRENRGNSSAIYFWQSGYQYTPDDKPEKTHDSFSDFVQEVIINWTFEDYNYDGSEKSE